jgi:hypothetical protein
MVDQAMEAIEQISCRCQTRQQPFRLCQSSRYSFRRRGRTWWTAELMPARRPTGGRKTNAGQHRSIVTALINSNRPRSSSSNTTGRFSNDLLAEIT